MAGKIAKSFIDDLLARANIVEVVERVVPLKKAGRDFQGLCPFHNEKSPSFTVSPEKQFYHCFGCGAHGSAIGFLMNHDGLGFVEAVEELAGMLGLDVQYDAAAPGASGAPAADYSGLYEITDEAQQLYARLLREHPSRQRAVDYLKGRGLTGEIAKRFGIGYAPAGWDTLCDALGTDAARRKLLVDAGLSVLRENEKFYDRFRDRIMFPIRDRRGRCIAFGGRIIDAGEPKYLNSPETPIFHKRSELYGLDQVLKRGKRPEKVLIVEGYMDVVALAQFGVDNAVATLGTATTGEQIEQLYRHVSEVVFCFDGDAAGRRAAWRALETVLPLLKEGRRAGFLFLPQGHDPDSLVRSEGPGVFAAKDKITALSTFLFDELSAKADISSLDGRAQLVALARPLISKVPPGPLRQLLGQHLQALAGTTVREASAPAVTPPRRQPPAPTPRGARPTRQVPSLLTRAIAMLVRQPTLAPLARDLPALDVATNPESALLVGLLERLEADPDMTTGVLLEGLRGTPQGELLEGILALPLLLDESHWAAEFTGAIEQMLKRSRRGEMTRRVMDTLAKTAGSTDGSDGGAH